jgi:dTDP-4-dehydrorhamnose reductase
VRILVFGKTGQVARELSRMEWPHSAEIVQLDRAQCDLCNPGAVASAVEWADSGLVVNAAAYTAVDRAESEPELAERINRDAPAAMAAACACRGAALIHLSTDYVFDGTKRDAYVEEDAVSPVSVYGRTKEAGEAAIREALDRHLIVRTSWVFSAHGTNFVKTMLRLAATRPELRVVADQKGGPTAARDIAKTIGLLVQSIEQGTARWGTYHYSGAEATTWFGFAQAILAEAQPRPSITPIATSEYPTAAQRPSNSILDCTRIRDKFGIVQPSWRDALKDTLAELQDMD